MCISWLQLIMLLSMHGSTMKLIYSWFIERFVQDLRFCNGFNNFVFGLILRSIKCSILHMNEPHFF